MIFFIIIEFYVEVKNTPFKLFIVDNFLSQNTFIFLFYIFIYFLYLGLKYCLQ